LLKLFIEKVLILLLDGTISSNNSTVNGIGIGTGIGIVFDGNS
jgi:hypothetical protein